jgi:hypothetical protein
VVLKPTDHLLLRCCCHPLAFITAEWQHKKNDEKASCFEDITVLFLTIFFHLTRCLYIMRPVCGIEARRPSFCAAAAASHSHSLQQSGSTKRRVRKHQVFMMLQFFTRHFFQ